MPLDPSIPLSIRPAEFTPPAQNIATLMAIRGQISELALRQQQSEVARQNALDIEQQRVQRERDNDSVSKMTSLMADPAVHDAIGKGDFTPIWKAGITPSVASPVIANIQKAQEAAQTLAKGKADFYAQGRSLLGSVIEGLDPTDDAKAADQFNSAVLNLSKEHPELAQQISQVAPGPNFRDQIKSIGTENGVFHSILANKAALDKTAADTSEATQRANQAQAAAAMDNFKLDLMKNGADPKTLAVSVAALIDPKLHPQAYQDAMAEAALASKTGDMKNVFDAVHGIYDKQIGAVQAQANLMPGEIKKATSIAQAEAPIHVGEQVAVQKSLAGLSPEPFRDIIDKGERDKLMDQTATARTNYANVLSDAQKILDTARAEQGTNKVAGAALTVDMARSLISGGRQLGPVMHSISSNSGNVMDAIEGRLKGFGGNDKLPPDIVKSIVDMSVITQQAAKRQYANDLENLKMRGVKTDLIPPPSIQPTQPNLPSIGTPGKDKNGKKVTVKGHYDNGDIEVE